MEELPKTPELIGGSDKTREQVDSYFRDEYAENDLNYAEIPLSPEQQDIVRAVIEAIPEFLKTYGVEADPKAMLDRIHMIDDSKLAEEDVRKLPGSAVHRKRGNRIYLKGSEANTSVRFFYAVCHELLHSISFDSFTINEGRMERAVLERRSGLGVLVEDQNRLDTYFDDINEAVTDRLTELFVQYVDQNPEAGITITKSDGFATAAYYASSTYEK